MPELHAKMLGPKIRTEWSTSHHRRWAHPQIGSGLVDSVNRPTTHHFRAMPRDGEITAQIRYLKTQTIPNCINKKPRVPSMPCNKMNKKLDCASRTLVEWSTSLNHSANTRNTLSSEHTGAIIAKGKAATINDLGSVALCTVSSCDS